MPQPATLRNGTGSCAVVSPECAAGCSLLAEIASLERQGVTTGPDEIVVATCTSFDRRACRAKFEVLSSGDHTPPVEVADGSEVAAGPLRDIHPPYPTVPLIDIVSVALVPQTQQPLAAA